MRFQIFECVKGLLFISFRVVYLYDRGPPTNQFALNINSLAPPQESQN